MSVTASELPPPPAPPASNIYPSIDELPLPAFIRCIVDADLTALVSGGPVPDDAILQEAWLSIYSQYCDRIGGVQIAALIQRARAVNALSSKIGRITMLIDAARVLACDELAAAFAADGYKLDPDAEEAEYFRQLDAIAAKLRTDKMRLDTLAKDLPKPEDNQEQASAGDFTRTLLEISKHEGYPVRAKDITTGEYCAHVERLRIHIDNIVKNNRNGGRARK